MITNVVHLTYYLAFDPKVDEERNSHAPSKRGYLRSDASALVPLLLWRQT